ncbi:hypothetical protein [Paenibacillus sp. MMO-58]|uniref:hypothetical protein n=1 Tax=Paenibacillus sp. MMO-58 TaxID=3081290 RepID=UPI003017F919
MLLWKRLKRFVIKPFVIFSDILLVKMYLVRYFIWDGSEPWVPILAGLPSVWVLFCLVEWIFPKRKLFAYVIVDLLVSAVYIAVTIFYKYFGVIPTYQALKQVGQVSEVKGSVFSLMHASFLFLFTDIVLFLIAILASHSFRKWGKARSVRERGVFVSIVFILSFTLSFVGI